MVAQTSARQRLGAVLEARRTSRIGWRCAFGLPRYSSGLGQHELDGKKNDPNWDLFLSTGRGHGFSEEAQRVSESTLDESRSSRSRKEPDVPILKARAPKEHSAFPGPRITYHKVTRISSNAPQFLPRSMVDPRIHFHKMGKIPFNVQTPSNARVSSTDIELINKLFGDAGEVGSREKAKHSNSDKGEGEHISSQCLEQVQAQRTSTYNVDCNSTAQGIAAPTQRSVRISKYLLIQPNHKRAPVRIQKAPVSSIRKIRVGNTEDFVYSLHSDDASHLVRRNGSSEDAIHETLEEKLALDRELDFVLDAFQNLQPSTFSTLDASDPSASTIGVGSPSSPSEQRITHDHVNAGYCSMPKPRRPYPNLSTMTQSRHYATATVSSSNAFLFSMCSLFLSPSPLLLILKSRRSSLGGHQDSTSPFESTLDYGKGNRTKRQTGYALLAHCLGAHPTLPRISSPSPVKTTASQRSPNMTAWMKKNISTFVQMRA